MTTLKFIALHIRLVVLYGLAQRKDKDVARIGSTTSTLDTRLISSHPAWLVAHLTEGNNK